MRVVNKERIAQIVKHNGITYTVLGDGRAYYLPDECYDGYKDLFNIIVPPKPKIVFPNLKEVMNNVMPRSLLYDTKIEPEKRDDLLENGAPRTKNNNFNWTYDLVGPDGTEYKGITKLKEFCMTAKLKYENAIAAARNCKIYSGWKVTRYKKEEKE
jgi:hypothetical protein